MIRPVSYERKRVTNFNWNAIHSIIIVILILTVVLFPQPLFPTRAIDSPGERLNDIFCRTSWHLGKRILHWKLTKEIQTVWETCTIHFRTEYSSLHSKDQFSQGVLLLEVSTKCHSFLVHDWNTNWIDRMIHFSCCCSSLYYCHQMRTKTSWRERMRFIVGITPSII